MEYFVDKMYSVRLKLKNILLEISKSESEKVMMPLIIGLKFCPKMPTFWLPRTTIWLS